MGAKYNPLVGVQTMQHSRLARVLRFGGTSTIATTLVLAGCGDIKTGPQLIHADGIEYVACGAYVRIFTDAGSFGVSFTDAEGLDHTLRGIKTLSTSELPAMVDAQMPLFAEEATAVDENGREKYVDGEVYVWADGWQARRRGDDWEAVRVPNDACKR